MPFLDFTAGDVLTAANMDITFRQGVMTFADASARDTALTGVLARGMVAYLEDTDELVSYNGSAWVLVNAGWQPIDSGSLAAASLDVSFTASKYSALRFRMRGSAASSTLITARLNGVSTSTYQYSLIESRGDTGAVADATSSGGAGLWGVGAWLTAANSLELTVLNTHLTGRQGFHSQSTAMSATTSAMRLAQGGGARTADLLPATLNILNNATATITAEWELEGYVR